MKIGIDIQTTLGDKTGFGFYVKNLVVNLKKVDKENKYLLFRPEEEKDLSMPGRFMWDQFSFPSQAARLDVDIIHQPCFSAPVFSKGKVVVTVHDLIALLYGKDIPFFSRMYFAHWMPFSYRKADRIIAISEHTKNDLIKYLKIPPRKIRVIFEAADESFKVIRDSGKIEKIKAKYKTGNNYFLHIGTLNPRKNLEFLINVFFKISLVFPQFNLVITGKRGWYYEGLFRLVQDLHLENKVIFTGYIDDKDKPYLYNGAKLFLFPSLYEGFGLPPLEAMACGTPVISSNSSSLPEVVGEGGVLLPPDNQPEWVKSIKQLITNKKLFEKYRQLGLKQAKKFSWEKCARETLKVYEELTI